MEFPIGGQVNSAGTFSGPCWYWCTLQDYNLVSMAFYLGAWRLVTSHPKLTFFIGFLVWEFPTVYISQKLRLAKYLGVSLSRVRLRAPNSSVSGVNIVLWGIVLMLHATTSSFGAFFALRFLLGKLLGHITLSYALWPCISSRDVRVVCCTYSRPDHLDVLQERWTGVL